MKPVRARIALASALGILWIASGCWVTPSRMTEKFNDFDDYLKKREARRAEETDRELGDLKNRVASLTKAKEALDVRVQGLKDDLVDLREKMGLALEAARRVVELQQKVERALDEVYAIEGRLRRNYEQASARVDDTLKKYSDVLEEEKRVLMERLRTINASLRAMQAKAEGEGEEGGGEEEE